MMIQGDNLAEVGGLLLAGIVSWKLVNALIDHFLKRTVSADYMTRMECDDKCRQCYTERARLHSERLAERRAERLDITEQLKEIRAMVLILALRSGASEEEIKEIVK